MKAKSVTKWVARIFGFISSCFFLSFMIGEGIDGLYKNADPKVFWFLLALAISIAGTFLAWFNAGLGGSIAFIGGIVLLAFHLFRGDLFTAFVYGVPFILSGFLFLVSIENRSRSRQGK